jgi:peptide deformylase
MKKMRIRYLGDPVLRRKARKVAKITPKTLETIESMWVTMYEANGIGLAAPQVGISQRIIVVDTREEGEKFALINPEILLFSEDKTPLDEGCLSIPGVEGEVFRPRKVRVRGLNPAGKPMEVEGDDLLAKVFQHEIDHLDGILFIDRVSPQELKRLRPELEKFETHAPA